MRYKLLKCIRVCIVLLEAIALSPTCTSSWEAKDNIVNHVCQFLDLLSKVVVGQVRHSIQGVSISLNNDTNFRVINWVWRFVFATLNPVSDIVLSLNQPIDCLVTRKTRFFILVVYCIFRQIDFDHFSLDRWLMLWVYSDRADFDKSKVAHVYQVVQTNAPFTNDPTFDSKLSSEIPILNCLLGS